MIRREDSGSTDLDDDEALAHRVRLSIDRSGLHGLRLIDVEVIGDTVILSGQVVTFHQKQLATSFARRVAGVIEVANRLEVHESWKHDGQGRPSNGRGHRHADETVDR